MSRSDAEMSRFAGTRDGTNGGGHGGSLLRRDLLSDVPNVPAEMSRSIVPIAQGASSQGFTPGPPANWRRDQLARELANNQVDKAARILKLPLFTVAEAGRGGMDSEYAKHVRAARSAA